MATEPTAYLVTLVGWRTTFIVFGGVILAGRAFVFLAAPENRRRKPPPALAAQLGELPHILKLPAVLAHRTAARPDLRHQHRHADPVGRALVSRCPGPRPAGSCPQPVLDGSAFMVGILSVGVVADRLRRRGIGPMPVMLGFIVTYFVAQGAHRLAGRRQLMFPAWLSVAASARWPCWPSRGLPRISAQDLAGRANATINFAMFVAAFTAQSSWAW